MKIITDNHTKSLGFIGCKRCSSVIQLNNTDVTYDGKSRKEGMYGFTCPVCNHEQHFKMSEMSKEAAHE